MPRRFRVALSFPGEHRSRVENIATILAARLGRDQILYDKWHAAEFNRANLDVYLSQLYHDDSDLIVAFLCQAYKDKEWCGLEGRVCRDLLKRKQDHRLMFFRLDDTEIPGLLSIDSYQDMRTMSDAEVAAAILQRLGEPGAPAAPRAFTAKLPIVHPTLIGRENEIAFLDRAWSDADTNFVQVIAAGGTGKTALVDKWFRRHLGEAPVFGWSFYSQGAAPGRQTSSDPFFAEILAWLHIDIPPTASIYAKADAVADRLRQERLLLILDGVEPLQDPSGALRDAALKALLQELDTANRGLVVCTTRLRMDIPDDPPRARALDLDNLTPEQGAEYLRHLKVEGTDEELQQASREYWNHALALTLLGTYLTDFCDADIRRRVEIPKLIGEEVREGAHASRVIAAYERVFAGKPELAILRALGHFDRPAEPEALKLVMPAMEDRKYRAALNRLHDARLILTTDPAQPIDCHPLVREHFAGQATREGHARLYEHYQKQAPRRPDTLEEMRPLFYAVYHGCRAGQHQAVLDDVYHGRIFRADEFVLTTKLGAFGTDLSLLASFFETPWIQPVATLSIASQALVIGQSGYTLRALGRLADAVEPLRAATESHVRSEDWKYAALRCAHLSILKSRLGDLQEAVVAARQAVDFADRSGGWFPKLQSRTTLAMALHLSGEFADAMELLADAERIQAEGEPEYQILYGVHGHRYCDVLLDQGQTGEVLRRASITLNWERGRLQQIGFDHLSLGCAHPAGTAEAKYHLDQAVDFLRRAGHLESLPHALLARGTPHDLDEVFRIATRSGMRLYLADCHLAKGNLAEAEALINATGYHRRDSALAALRARVAAVRP
jgi:tetratricopeptide (TPR) repeat protein